MHAEAAASSTGSAPAAGSRRWGRRGNAAAQEQDAADASGGARPASEQPTPTPDIAEPALVARSSAGADDPDLPEVADDPRGEQRQVNIHARGRNSQSFDPTSTMVRPAMRVLVGRSSTKSYDKPLRHDDVVIVPGFFCQEDDWSIYYRLVAELRDLQAAGVKDSEWVAWHEGCHLISKRPEGSALFREVVNRTVAFFDMIPETLVTRLNWYRDCADWKPFHHDSAAFNPHNAKRADVTVGVSFGATRELAFLHALNGTLAYFPQTNGMLFSFGRDVNIKWKHGVNAVPLEQRDGRGRISIILFGKLRRAIDEEGSPALLSNDGGAIRAVPPASGTRHSRSDICRYFRQGLCPAGDACQSKHVP